MGNCCASVAVAAVLVAPVCVVLVDGFEAIDLVMIGVDSFIHRPLGHPTITLREGQRSSIFELVL